MIFCDCTGRPPWPAMLRVHAGGEINRYYLCRRCGSIREHVCRADGTILDSRYHHLESAALPAAVVQQAREILSQPHYSQPSLFGE
jgi:hypothetical protein